MLQVQWDTEVALFHGSEQTAKIYEMGRALEEKVLTLVAQTASKSADILGDFLSFKNLISWTNLVSNKKICWAGK